MQLEYRTPNGRIKRLTVEATELSKNERREWAMRLIPDDGELLRIE